LQVVLVVVDRFRMVTEQAAAVLVAIVLLIHFQE
jgi:hypothetical protein